MMDKRSSSISSMNDSEFDDLLRSVKVEVPLPSAFQAEAWRRIEAAESDSIAVRLRRWIEAAFGVLVRPMAASMAVMLMVSAGLWLGAKEPSTIRDSKIAYVQSVSPFAQAHQGEHR